MVLNHAKYFHHRLLENIFIQQIQLETMQLCISYVNYTNVSSNAKANYNSCSDVLELATVSHVLAAAINYLKMQSLDDVPLEAIVEEADSVWIQPKEEGKKSLD